MRVRSNAMLGRGTVLYGEQAPFVRDTFERTRTAIGKSNPRARDQVFHRARHEDLAGFGFPGHSGADVDGDAPHVVTHQLALARVQACPKLDPQRSDFLVDGGGAADRPRRSVEGRDETISARIDLPPAVPAQLPPNDSVVRLEQGTPGTIAENGRTLGGADDVSEEYGGEYAIELHRRP